MIALGLLLLVIGPPLLVFPHQMARLGRPSSGPGRARYEQQMRARGLPQGWDEEDEVSRVRERLVGLSLTVVGLILVFLF